MSNNVVFLLKYDKILCNNLNYYTLYIQYYATISFLSDGLQSFSVKILKQNCVIQNNFVLKMYEKQISDLIYFVKC